MATRYLLAILASSSVLISAGSARGADLTGAWKVEFSQGGPVQDTCRFTLVQGSSGQVQGRLSGCGVGTPGIVSGAIDIVAGTFALVIVAPDDLFCEVYGMDGTIAPDSATIEGAFTCASPSQEVGIFDGAPCDLGLPGDCPGTTVHEVRACTPDLLASACETSASARSFLRLRHEDSFHDDITLRIPKTSATEIVHFGSPLDLTDHVVCIYETIATTPRLVAMEPVFAGGSCVGKPCWSAKSKGFSYRNSKALGGKMTKLKLRATSNGLGKIIGRGSITAARIAPASLPLGLPVVVQFLGPDFCWSATFLDAKVNDGDDFEARGGQ